MLIAFISRLKFYWLSAALLFLAAPVVGFAQEAGGFSGGVTPSRFEVSAQPGDRVARSLSIYNLGVRPEEFRVFTNDWDFTDQGSLAFSDALTENSCRPWVKLERHKISIVPDPNRPRKFRFEVQVPEDAPNMECRFAIMIESLGEAHETVVGNGAIKLPTTGRLAVIVYLGIGDAAPKSSIIQTTVVDVNSRLLPVVEVINEGIAHDRFDGTLRGADGNGVKLDLSIATSPILSGQRAFLALSPSQEYIDQYKEITYPLALSGKLYSENGTFSIDATVGP